MQNYSIELAESAIRNSRNLKLRVSLKYPKDTIILLLADNNLESPILQSVGAFMLGSTLVIDEQLAYSSQAKSEIEIQSISLTQDFSLILIEAEEVRVIGIDYSYFQKSPNGEKAIKNYLENLCYLKTVERALNQENYGSKIKIFALAQYRNKINEIQSRLVKIGENIGATNIGIIFCNCDPDPQNSHQNSNRLYLLGQKGRQFKNKHEFPVDSFFNTGNDSFEGIFNFDKLAKKQDQINVIKNLKKMLINSQKSIDEIFKPVKNIFRNCYESRESDNVNIFKQICKIIKPESNLDEEEHPYIQSIMSKSEVWEENLTQNYSDLAYLKFYADFKEIFQKLSKQSDESLQHLKKFFTEAFRLLNSLPLELSATEISKLYQYLRLQVDEIETLQKILALNSTIVSYTTRGFLDSTKKLFPNNHVMLEALLKKPIKTEEKEEYYNFFKKLIQSIFNPEDYPKADRFEIEKKVNFFLIKIQTMKVQRITKLNIGKNQKKIAEAIYFLFQIYEKEIGLGKCGQSNELCMILEKCAQLLRAINCPALALNFYKKLKFVHKLESCAQEVLAFENDEQKFPQFYISLAKYFLRIGWLEYARKYAQLAFEQNQQYQFTMNNDVLILKGEAIKINPNQNDLNEQFREKLKTLHLSIEAQPDELRVEILEKDIAHNKNLAVLISSIRNY